MPPVFGTCKKTNMFRQPIAAISVEHRRASFVWPKARGTFFTGDCKHSWFFSFGERKSHFYYLQKARNESTKIPIFPKFFAANAL